jgi:hypothetical protein
MIVDMTKQPAAAVRESSPDAAREAADTALGELRREVLRRAGPTLATAGIPVDQAECRIETETMRLHVRFDLPIAVTPGVKQALAVRVLDAVRGAGRTYGSVEVTVHGPTGRGC